MKKLITLAMIAVTFAGSLVVTTGEADARSRRHRNGDAAAAAAAGVVGGLILGGIIASQSREPDYYYGRGYRTRYYGGHHYRGDRVYQGGPHYRNDRVYYGEQRRYDHSPVGSVRRPGSSVNEFVPGSR